MSLDQSFRPGTSDSSLGFEQWRGHSRCPIGVRVVRRSDEETPTSQVAGRRRHASAGSTRCYARTRSRARSDPADVARVEDRTFICLRSAKTTRARRTTGATGENRASSGRPVSAGAMRGRTLYVVAVSMGRCLADRAHRRRAHRLTRTSPRHWKIIDPHWEAKHSTLLGDDGEFVPVVHSVGAPLRARRGAMSRGRATPTTSTSVTNPETREIGRTDPVTGQRAIGKKCFALRIASHHGARRRLASPSTC